MEEESEVMASDVHTKKWGAERWMHSTEETFKKMAEGRAGERRLTTDCLEERDKRWCADRRRVVRDAVTEDSQWSGWPHQRKCCITGEDTWARELLQGREQWSIIHSCSGYEPNKDLASLLFHPHEDVCVCVCVHTRVSLCCFMVATVFLFLPEQPRWTLSERAQTGSSNRRVVCLCVCLLHPCFSISFPGCVLGPWRIHALAVQLVLSCCTPPSTPPTHTSLSPAVFVFSCFSFSCSHTTVETLCVCVLF